MPVFIITVTQEEVRRRSKDQTVCGWEKPGVDGRVKQTHFYLGDSLPTFILGIEYLWNIMGADEPPIVLTAVSMIHHHH